MKQYDNSILSPCPYCGTKAFISHDSFQGYDFGWDVGCPRYCNNDDIHGLDENAPMKRRPIIHHCYTREEAILKWNTKAKTIKELMEGEIK